MIMQPKSVGKLRLGARHVSPCIDAEEDEEKEREAPQRRAAIGEKGQRNAYDGGETEHHAHIDEHMEEKNAEHTVAIDAAKAEGLALG